MQLGFTIFTKLFHSVQFLLLWSFLRKLLRRLLTATNKSKTGPFWLCFTHGLRLYYRLGYLPSFYSGIFPTAVINYFALYSEAESLPRLKLRTAYAFLLTIRRSQRRIRSLLYKNAGWGETRLLYNGLSRVQYIDFIPEFGLIFGCLLALKSNYIFFLHVCFAIID